MREIRYVKIHEIAYPVVLSDETEALLKAKADGKASVGLWHREQEAGSKQDLSSAAYLVERLEDADSCFLERVVRRHLGLPWKITETERVLVREFTAEDAERVPKESGDREADALFYQKERLREYIRCQYGFYEWGIWALEEKMSGRLIGKAGLTPMESESFSGVSMELGYHIFQSYRQMGLAVEVCTGILNYAAEMFEEPLWVYAEIDASNEASIRVVQKLGFKRIEKKYSQEKPGFVLYGLYLPKEPDKRVSW